MERLLLPVGDDFDQFLARLAGNPPELETVANLMVDGGFATVLPVAGGLFGGFRGFRVFGGE